MSANAYSLESVVSFLESTLGSFGMPKSEEPAEGRLELRRRYRQMQKAAERLSRESLQPPSRYWERYPGLDQDPESMVSRLYGADSTIGSERGYDVAYPPGHCSPFVADTQVTQLNSALRIAFGGLTTFFRSVVDSWSRSLEVDRPGSNPSRPLRRLADDRLYLALMRFVFGFFGSHKVDARNNP